MVAKLYTTLVSPIYIIDSWAVESNWEIVFSLKRINLVFEPIYYALLSLLQTGSRLFRLRMVVLNNFPDLKIN